MRIGLISDLHAYRLPTLMAIKDIRRFMRVRTSTSIVCLGDVASGGKQEKEVVDILMNNAVLSIKGNHCKNEARNMEESVRSYIENSKDCRIYKLYGKRCIYVHDNPLSVLAPYDARMGRHPWEEDSGIKTDEQARAVFEKTDFAFIFVGHTHIPESWEMTKGGEVIHRYMYRGKLNPESRHIINPGAVADPKVLTPHSVANPKKDFVSNYAILDMGKMRLMRFSRELFRDGKPVFNVPENEKWIYR